MKNKKIILSDICIYKIGLKRKLSQQIEKIQQQVNDLCIELEDNLRDCELADIEETVTIDHKSQMLSSTNLKGTSSSVGQIHHDIKI
jgi:hypothetical protein